jgi:CRISPR/Cas system-associated protein Cas7 (RAMP superfamily)
MKNIEEYHANIKYKSNKYIYFNDDTHMSHSDFHKMCNEMKYENNEIIRTHIDGSQHLFVMTADEAQSYSTGIDYTLYMIEELKNTD